MPGRFHVAFSFAGAQRGLVMAMAEEVERRLGFSTVFYDDWFEHEIAGRNADLLLQRLYADRCELVVVCVSGEYDDRQWTRIEHEAVRARYQRSESEEDRKRVLLVRVGDGEVEGILCNAIVPDIRSRSPEAACDLIIARLESIDPSLSDHESPKPSSDWPKEAPALRWPLADHAAARLAFAQLITANSSFRLLCIRGSSETGKSTISQQMHSIGYNLPGVTCGRFDFKGTNGLDGQIDSFAFALDVPKPAEGRLNLRLSLVHDELARRARPTLIVLDTYEDVGEAAEWAEQRLLMALSRSPWLRVVVLGQSLPRCADMPWEGFTHQPIALVPPSPEDWLEYGREHHPDADRLTLEEVLLTHRLARGKPALLAEMLRPT